jgi:hypothetical protein
MNGTVKCVENQGKIIKFMHVKCKYVIIVVWNIFAGFKFHFYQKSIYAVGWPLCCH